MGSERLLENWDPMKDDFSIKQTYESKPGADRNELLMNSRRESNHTGYEICIRYLPYGITSEGVKNLCLGAGIPMCVTYNPAHRVSYVKFKTLREAELAVRDLNKTPPYNLSVSFARHMKGKFEDHEKEYSDGSLPSEETGERDGYDMFVKLSPMKTLPKQGSTDDNSESLPYFCITSEFDDPSLVMRQRYLDYESSSTCVSLGRGYFKKGNADPFKPGSVPFIYSSSDWIDNDEEIVCCIKCGTKTFRKIKSSTESYCSNNCKADMALEGSSGSQSNIDSIFDLFAIGKSGFLKLLKREQGPCIPSCIVLEDEIQYFKEIENVRNHSGLSIRAKEGDEIITLHSNGRILRGVVLSIEDGLYRVALKDYGIIITSKEVYAVPDAIFLIPAFGGVAVVTAGCSQYDGATFRIKKKGVFDSWLCDLVKTDTCEVLGEVILEKWSPPLCLRHIPITSGCTVVITSFRSMNTVFVRPVDDTANEDFIRFCNDVAEYSLGAPKYQKLPKYGEVCSALYEKDGCYYRAVVRSVKRQSVVVMFVDFGNEQETDLNNLKHLPSAAREVHCFAVKIRLSGVPEKSSPATVEYFNELTANGTELCLSHTDQNVNEYILSEKHSGKILNKAVCDMLVPIWERDESVFLKSGEIFYLESLEEAELKVGETEDIFVLNFDEDIFNTTGTFWVTPYRTDYLFHLNNELKENITNYCSYILHDSYLPRKGELCLVQWQGEWNRGVAVNDSENIIQAYLIDRGILCNLESKYFRKILREFLEMPALALEGKISGYDRLEPNAQQMVIQYMKRVSRKCIKQVKILQKIEHQYHLSVPYVDDIIIE